MAEIYQLNHRAMATQFEVRIANENPTYAAQAAQAAIDLLDKLESQLSRFRRGSDIVRAAHLVKGEKMRLSESTFACLEMAKKMEAATCGGFCATAAAPQTEAMHPQWTLLPDELSLQCESGTLAFDLGAIGKGFALDRMAELLRVWECFSVLLVAGGSSVLASDAPPETAGWSCSLGNDHSTLRLLLKHASLSGSGLAVKGSHILNPRNGRPAMRQNRAWALADSAAESDALSTACMVLNDHEIEKVLEQEPSWLVFLDDDGTLRTMGKRPLLRN